MSTILFRLTRKSRWLLPVGALVICNVALALTLLAHHWLTTELRRELAQKEHIGMALDGASRATAPACAPEFNYAQSLPSSVSLDRLLQALQDSSKAFGVTVQSVSGEPHPATPMNLATLEVSITLHGAYPAIKSTLAESLSRFQSGALQSLRIKRASVTVPMSEDASVQFVVVLRPQTFGPADCRTAPIDIDSVRSN